MLHHSSASLAPHCKTIHAPQWASYTTENKVKIMKSRQRQSGIKRVHQLTWRYDSEGSSFTRSNQRTTTQIVTSRRAQSSGLKTRGGGESTKVCHQHPCGQLGALSELTWATEPPSFLLAPLSDFFFPLRFSPPYGRVHLLPSPCPAAHSIEMASLPHKTYACLHRHPQSRSHVSFTVRLWRLLQRCKSSFSTSSTFWPGIEHIIGGGGGGGGAQLHPMGAKEAVMHLQLIPVSERSILKIQFQ